MLKFLRELRVRLTYERHEIYYEHLLRAISSRIISVDFMNVEIEDKRESKLSPLTLADWYAAELLQNFWRSFRDEIKLASAAKSAALQSRVSTVDQQLLRHVLGLLEKQQLLEEVRELKFRNSTSEQLSHWDSMHRSLSQAFDSRVPLRLADVLSNDELCSIFSEHVSSRNDPPQNLQFLLDLAALEKVRTFLPT